GSSNSMSERRRITVNTVGDVHVVRFNDRKILDATYIGELGDELFALLEEPGSQKLLLNFDGVEFLSSGALNKLIFLDRRVKEVSGSLRLTNLRPELNEVFMITRLHELFKIFEDEVEALADLNSDA
ncbi:MAG: STAS domain-containing protein, partial [Planctomycetota bacterium]|nr:STAS domain-containing protein [Planctomycetota bacterium]